MEGQTVVDYLINNGLLEKVETRLGISSVWVGKDVVFSVPLPIPEKAPDAENVPMAIVIMDLLNYNFNLTSEDIHTVNQRLAGQTV